MFRVMLYSQWKWSRLIVALGSIAAFALPIVSVQGAARADSNPLRAGELLQAVQAWGTLYPVLAAALGLLVAIATWAPDHRGRHVHALSLPLPRWRYVLLRFGAGGTLLAAPVIAVAAGALLATWSATIPAGLQGYPVALAIRFALAVLVAYAVFFAVSAGTARTAGIMLGLIGGVILVQIIAGVANLDLDLFGKLQIVVLNWPGPLAIFSGRWMLIDV
ncbi:MAG: hypothetical protein AUH78_09355 [Gemmatimonadetes bacterium 13_1_40CM_4_69_8]|nr:MAG: hypothetical protein AUH78_09355 [Gemmatimonadetes bacterium 13_1_40CM_4_69_8]